jgi:catechol 2,3-dioxygenase-like lactoylglutathione lyase family enzyme
VKGEESERMALSERLAANHTGITVSDIDRAIRFWRDVAGFEVTDKVRRGGELFAAITGVAGAEIDIAYVKAPGHLIELLEYVKPDDTAVSRVRPCDPGHMHLCFTVDNIDAVVEAAKPGASSRSVRSRLSRPVRARAPAPSIRAIRTASCWSSSRKLSPPDRRGAGRTRGSQAWVAQRGRSRSSQAAQVASARRPCAHCTARART